jgi:LuxR family maltose regulon positive regulatory protein
MAGTLLATKLHIPPVRPTWMPRSRLIERLDAGLQHKFTLVSAPAGFGKTTLLSEWSRQVERPVAWFALDRADNDPTQFWSYFIAALQQVRANLGAAVLDGLQSPQPLASEALLTGLLNELAENDDPLVLVLDDFHLLTAPQLHEALLFFQEHVPAHVHLVLAGRVDPPWPLARMRARGEMAELRAGDLRFTVAEATAFFNDVMGLDLSPEDIAALESRTEGWIAGLHMAALSMQGREDRTLFVQAFGASHRFILDYLLEEVLNRQSAEIQEFLLQTAILERMTASLCDAVAGREESQAVLMEMDRANLFVVPLDDERRWYRYHQLFGDLLRSRLQQEKPDQVATLHSRASAWYEAQGLIGEAVEHAVASGNVERLRRLVEGNALTMVNRGELATLSNWLDALPDEVVHRRAWLSVARAWVLTCGGDLESAEHHLQDADRAVEYQDSEGGADEGIAPTEKQRVAGHIAAIRAYTALLQGDASRAVEQAYMALEFLPPEDLPARGVAARNLGIALRWGGDLATAAQVLKQAATAAQAAGDSYMAVTVLGDLALQQLGQGQLRQSYATCQEALRIAERYAQRSGRRLPAAGYAYVFLSFVLREWNELEEARRCAETAIELCRQWSMQETLTDSYTALTWVLLAQGDIEGAFQAAQQSIQLAAEVSPWYVALTQQNLLQAQLARGNLAFVVRWMEENYVQSRDRVAGRNLHWFPSIVAILLALGQSEEAVRILAHQLETVNASNQPGRAVVPLALQALALQAQEQTEQALDSLSRALELGEAEGFVRTFVDGGPPMQLLLREIVRRGSTVPYARKLLEAFGEPSAGPQAVGQRALATRESGALPSQDVLVEPLSARELEVLGLVATGLSNKEVAAELIISVGTVKNHLKNIYGKLGVGNRVRAGAYARELGLLPQE